MNIKNKKTRRHHNGGKDGYKRQDVLHEFRKCEKYEFRKKKKKSVLLFRTEKKDIDKKTRCHHYGGQIE